MVHRRHAPSMSLVISPNLDALLANDHRSHSAPTSAVGHRPPTDDLVGLPPPPRGPRKPVKKSGPPLPVATYINRAPQGIAPSRVFRLEAEPRRPMISHAQQPSIDSMDSASSLDPASTAENEPRISISSTVYPASSDNSHQPSFYNEPRRDSFIDLFSPLNPDFDGLDDDALSTSAPVSPINFAKPPLPTTPKPDFSHRMSPSATDTDPRPPTTNFLDMGERADLVRKSRKLTRLFGQTPGAAAMAHQERTRPAVLSGPARARAAFSLIDPVAGAAQGVRRHSLPLSPDDISFLSISSPPLEHRAFPRTPTLPDDDAAALAVPRGASPESFIDLSDEDVPHARRRRPRPASVASLDTLAPAAQAEDERRRKRERLAKLHRFLGSRVPAHLVLGLDDPALTLPPPAATEEGDDAGAARRVWLKRRRSSSAAARPTPRADELERVREELDGREKALNVRRAHKMEKVFGVAPPQTLYHTRHCPTPSPSSRPMSVASDPVPPTPPGTPTSAAAQRASVARAAYMKPKGKKGARPGTADSSKQLLPKEADTPPASAALSAPAEGADAQHSSLIYSHYQHSLNSLHDILDRDDRESLAELHEYLNCGAPGDGAPPAEGDDFNFASNAAGSGPARDRRLSTASSLRSERRRSLPARTSRTSLRSPTASEITLSPLPTPPPTATTGAAEGGGTDGGAAFQLRRRRAAKLTQFFGVNYRELIADVLESIESGVAAEQQRGTLRMEEVEDLLTKLRTLKTKRTGLF